jgi:hypothetical protein
MVYFLLSLPPPAGLFVINASAIWSKAARRAARAADAVATSGLPLTISPGRTSTPVGWARRARQAGPPKARCSPRPGPQDRESGPRSVIVRGDQNPSGTLGVPPGRPLTEPGRQSRRSQLSGVRVGLSRPDKTKYPDRDRVSRAAPSFACRGTWHLPMAFGSFRPWQYCARL